MANHQSGQGSGNGGQGNGRPTQPNSSNPPPQLVRPIALRPNQAPSQVSQNNAPPSIPSIGFRPIAPVSLPLQPNQPSSSHNTLQAPSTLAPPRQQGFSFQPPPFSVPQPSSSLSNNQTPLQQPTPVRPVNHSLISNSNPSSVPPLGPFPRTAPPNPNTGQLRSHSPGGTLYERDPTLPPPTKKRKTKRESAGYDNPSHSHGNMLPLWRDAAVSPPPPNTTKGSAKEKQWLMNKSRRFSTKDPSGKKTGIIQGHNKGVLGHLPDASSHWNGGGHQQPRKSNLAHNRQTSTYHGIERNDLSSASGSLAPRYNSPTPDKGSHPSHWNPNHPDYDANSAWMPWRPIAPPPSQSSAQANNSAPNQPSAPSFMPPVSSQPRPQTTTGPRPPPQFTPMSGQGFNFAPPQAPSLSQQASSSNAPSQSAFRPTNTSLSANPFSLPLPSSQASQPFSFAPIQPFFVPSQPLPSLSQMLSQGPITPPNSAQALPQQTNASVVPSISNLLNPAPPSAPHPQTNFGFQTLQSPSAPPRQQASFPSLSQHPSTQGKGQNNGSS